MSEPTQSPVRVSPPATAPAQTKKTERKELPPFNVVLLNDDDHTYQYVVNMLHFLFGYDEKVGMELAKTLDKQNRVVVLTTHKEKAELKRDQIRGFGTDPRVANCSGSMSAKIEPLAE